MSNINNLNTYSVTFRFAVPIRKDITEQVQAQTEKQAEIVARHVLYERGTRFSPENYTLRIVGPVAFYGCNFDFKAFKVELV